MATVHASLQPPAVSTIVKVMPAVRAPAGGETALYPSWMISGMGSADIPGGDTIRQGRQRVGFKQADPVAGFNGGDREPDGECALASAALARNQSDRVHGVFVSSLRIVKVCCYARQIRRYKARTCPQTSRAAIRKTAYASLNKLLIVSVRKRAPTLMWRRGSRLWRNCSIFSGWRDHPQGRFSCSSRTVRAADCFERSALFFEQTPAFKPRLLCFRLLWGAEQLRQLGDVRGDLLRPLLW